MISLSHLETIKCVMIYQASDEGSTHDFTELFKSIQRSTPQLAISSVCKDRFISTIKTISPDKLHHHLLVIPAQESSKLDADFSSEEITEMQNAIRCGLNIYTTCGSAYWVAQQRIWTGKGVPCKKESKIGLFPGIALGPLISGDDDICRTNYLHKSVAIRIKEKTVHVLLSGGGTFSYPAEAVHKYSTKVLACYQESNILPLTQAIVSCRYGQGVVILSMPHLECSREDINPKLMEDKFPHRPENWHAIKNALSDDPMRIECVIDILNQALSERDEHTFKKYEDPFPNGVELVDDDVEPHFEPEGGYSRDDELST